MVVSAPDNSRRWRFRRWRRVLRRQSIVYEIDFIFYVVIELDIGNVGYDTGDIWTEDIMLGSRVGALFLVYVRGLVLLLRTFATLPFTSRTSCRVHSFCARR